MVAVIDARRDELDVLESDVRMILGLCREECPDVPVAIGLAVQEIETWMLADPESRFAAFGSVGRDWSATELEGVEDPKSKWAYLSGMAPAPEGKDEIAHADDRRKAAWLVFRSAVVATACPRGFRPFLESLKHTVASLGPSSSR